MKGVLIPCAALASMAAVGWGVSGLESTIHPKNEPTNLDAHETHASASLLGQFRTSVTAWLWVRTDLYLHNGVEMRPMTDAERQRGLQSQSSKADGHAPLFDESAITTVVPPKERDFRGVFGDIEREISAYREMSGHEHNDPEAALPLFRLMTWIDPSFIAGWSTGASVIVRDRSSRGTRAALAYLEEGLRQNPKNPTLLVDYGEIVVTRLRDPGRAASSFEAAVDATEGQLVAGSEEAETLRKAYRWLGLCYRGLGRRDLIRSRLGVAVQLFPDDVVLQRLLNPPPLVFADETRLMTTKPVERVGP